MNKKDLLKLINSIPNDDIDIVLRIKTKFQTEALEIIQRVCRRTKINFISDANSINDVSIVNDNRNNISTIIMKGYLE